MHDVTHIPASGRAMPRDMAAAYVPSIRRTALRIARRLPAHVCVDDLIGAGLQGLVEAYRRYDPKRCDRFEAYAEMRIRGAMVDELRSYDPLSRDLRALAQRTAAATRKLEHRHGRAATEAEIAAELGLSLEAFRGYAGKMAVGHTVSLDSGHDDDVRIEVAEKGTSAEEHLVSQQTRNALNYALRQLPQRQQQVLEMYYREEKTLRQIGDILGVTESRACQIHGEALQRVRALYALKDGEGARISRLPPPPPAPARPRPVRRQAA
jgi:RNA polymerase sigma factor for flagellar operon FliA